MASSSGTNATLVDAGGVSTIGAGLVDGRVKCMLDDYTIDGATDTVGSTIKLGGKIPKGAKIIAILLKVTANQTSATLDIGDAEDTDRYAAADTSLQTAGSYIFGCNNYEVDETVSTTLDSRILLTVGGATLSAATLYAAIFYTTD